MISLLCKIQKHIVKIFSASLWNAKVYISIKIYIRAHNDVNKQWQPTNRFDYKTGVKQNDDLSPTLYSIFVNDMVQETNNLHVGIELVNRNLLYAYDIALIMKSTEDL